MQKSIVVLGAGMVGGFIARKLAGDERFRVTLCDRDPAALDRSAKMFSMDVIEADLSNPAVIAKLVAGADLVAGAVPGFLGYRMAEAVLSAGRHLVDISFFPEDPFGLEALAREKNLLAVVDCGVTPGLGGMLAVDLARRFEKPDRLTILVGGLPAERIWPTEYKAPFSPIDVIEEYVRPARYRERGEIVIRPALSEAELVDLPGVGTLEAFNTDGLRTMLRTIDIPNMKEKTLRYPGHIEKMRMLREMGFFDERPRRIGGQEIRPLDVTAALLFEEWKLVPGTEELTVMRVEVEGKRNGKSVIERCDLLDRTDSETGDSSMARTTGYPAVIASTLFLEGKIARRGLSPAETLAEDASLFEEICARLARVGVKLRFETVAA